MYVTKNVLNSATAKAALTEHKFLTRSRLHLYASQAGSFLPAVMLLFHQQIQLIQAIHPRAVFLLIIAERLQQSYHCYATLMFQRFHLVTIFGLFYALNTA